MNGNGVKIFTCTHKAECSELSRSFFCRKHDKCVHCVCASKCPHDDINPKRLVPDCYTVLFELCRIR